VVFVADGDRGVDDARVVTKLSDRGGGRCAAGRGAVAAQKEKPRPKRGETAGAAALTL
jgi:hypothetical protein